MSKFIPNLFIYSLKGKSVWSDKLYDRIDVACIMQMRTEKRLFCILDRDHPYSLRINYYDANRAGPASSSVPVKGFIDNKDSKFTIVRRFKSMELCEQEMAEITDLQKRLGDAYDKIVRDVSANRS